MTVNTKTEVAQNLRAEPVAQADILESDHAVLRKGLPMGSDSPVPQI
jgi:hypothetical protein